MVVVYFESKTHAEQVATFEDEELFNLCLPLLEKHAEENRMFLTETILTPEEYAENRKETRESEKTPKTGVRH